MNPVNFRKGFNDSKMHDAFMTAVASGDCAEIAAVVVGTGMERLPVDCMINGVPRALRPSNSVISEPLMAAPEFGSSGYEDAMDLLHQLADLRDKPLASLPSDLHRGLREVSPWLADETIHAYAPGTDYGTDKDSHEAIQMGKALMTDQRTANVTTIQTGRDAAAYVHADNIMKPWFNFLSDMLKDGCKINLPESMKTDLVGQSGFALYGQAFLEGMMGEALRKAGSCSFYKKWDIMAPRPEESSPVLGMGYLPLTYAEGSPMHPSDHSMHSVATCTCKNVLLKFLDKDHRYQGGETVESHAELLADNVGMFRFWAGVHFPWEHSRGDELSAVIADEICAPYLK